MLPEGNSLSGFKGVMTKAPMGVHREGDRGHSDGVPDWLGSSSSEDALADQAATTDRGWSFGWIRLAHGTRRVELARSLVGTGVEIVGSAGRLLRVRFPGETPVSVIAELPGVDGIGALPAAAKLRAFDRQVPESALPDPIPVFITLMADDSDGRWRRELTSLGAVIAHYDPAIRVYTANVDGSLLNTVAAADFVLAVEPVGVVAATHDTAVPAMGSDVFRLQGDSPGVFTGTGGASVPIGVMDTGLNINHPDIAEHRSSICGANFVSFQALQNDTDLWVDARHHGTHVTGTIAGNGFMAPRFAGMAPSVRHLRVAKVLDYSTGFGTTHGINRAMDFLAEESVCAGSDAVRPLIVNMSLASRSPYFVGRDVNARKLDATVWHHRQLYVVAQANAGAAGFSNYAAAKNSLAVGAAYDDGHVATFSSHGPTGDGRLAPQVVGTGVEVCSTEGNGKGAGYICFQGTSMASPSVAGVAALLMDAIPDYRSRPALARARLMASAVRPDAWFQEETAFPATNTDGPGTLHALYGLGKVSGRLAVRDRDQADGWTGGGAVADVEDESEYAFSDIVVPEGASRLDVVMTWDEPPTEAIANPVLNDLDLWLDRGADCNDGPCGEQSSVSRMDNVEWIVVHDPEPGTYRAKVVPSRIYTAPPRAAVSWTVIRGESTPSLGMSVEESPLDGSGEERRLEVEVTITADAYVAAGVRLHLECRGAGTACEGLVVGGAKVAREDGVTSNASEVVTVMDYLRNETRSPMGMASRISLGEVAVGESQTVTLDVAYAGDQPVHLYVTASAWNAKAVSGVLAVLPPGAVDDSEVVDPLEVPANDHFVDAQSLPATGGSMAVDLLRATPEPGEPPLDWESGRPLGSLWYEWTAPSTELVRFSVTSASKESMGAYLDVYQGGRLGGLDHIVSNWRREYAVTTEGDSVLRTIFVSAVFFAQAGETYRVRVAHGGHSVPLVLRWRQGPRPENDDFVDAERLTGTEGSVDGDNSGATLEAGELVGPLAASTWYRWTAPEDGAWQFEVDADHPLRVAVFQGSDLEDLRLSSGIPSNTASLIAQGGAEYRVAVASRDAYIPGSSYGLSWEKAQWTPVSGDQFAQAEALGESFSLGDETVETGEPEESGVRTRWGFWIAPSTGRYSWKLDSPWAELTVAAFTGDALENLELVGRTGRDAISGEFSFPAVEGERYWLSIGWPTGDYGAYRWPAAWGSLFRGPTPRNDELEDAIALGSTRGLTTASNGYATTAPGELAEQLGHSTVWWTYETPISGWYEFYTTDTLPVLAVFEVGATGSLREISRNRSGRVVFRADVGKQYVIRASAHGGSYGGSFGLYWKPVDAPAWLKYLGTFAEAADSLGSAVRLIDAGSLALDGDGSALYAVTAAGLTTFGRDADTGELADGTSIDDDLSGSLLVYDRQRDRLIANRCGTWRAYSGLDDEDGPAGRDLEVQDDPASCGRRLFFDPDGEFLYRVAPELGIEAFGIEDDDFRHVGTTLLAGIKDAVIAPNGDYVYAVHLDSTSHVRTFRRDQANGLLTRQDLSTYFPNLDDMDTLAIADDERLFVTSRSSAYTAGYELAEGVLSPAGDISILSAPNLSVHLARPFEFTSARSGNAAVDAFGASVALGLHVQQGEIDLLGNGGKDRFGNRLPLFGAPNGLASSPDGRHVYLSTYQDGIVAFERVGAGVEPKDPHVRLDILEVSSGTVSFSEEMDSDGCIAVSELDHDGIAYTVQDSKWQWRPNADWPWTDVAGTETTGEFCPHTPTEPGHYRLVAEVVVDGDTRQHMSNILVHDDHGDSIDDATTVGVPSVTAGWLDPDDDDYFRLELEQSGKLTIHSEGWINAEGRLLGGEGDLLSSDSDSAADYNFRMVADLEEGTYFVGVDERLGRPGAYTVHVEIEDHFPDLVVELARLSDDSPDVGESFTLTATVRNNGHADSAETTLRYYRSTDAEISTQDAEIGSVDVDPLGRGESADHSIEVTVADDGSYSYGACVDATDGESDTTNNCSEPAIGPGSAFELHGDNSHPVAVAHVDGLLYVVNSIDDRVYVYTTDGEHRPDSDFELDADTERADSIVHADGLLYVGVNFSDSSNKVYAYTVSGERRPDSDFEFEAGAPWWPSGLTHADGLLYVVDERSIKVYAYTVSGERRSGSDFRLDGHFRPRGIAHADGLLYVVDTEDDKVYAYDMSGARQSDDDFELDPDNGEPRGIDHVDGRFYVVDIEGYPGSVFVYTGD